jgi:hypothetical protein
VHADAAGAEDGDRRVRDLKVQASAVLKRATVLVGAMIGAVLEELVEEVAVGTVDLNAVEAGGLGVFGSAAEGFDDAGDLFERESAGSYEVLLGPDERDMAARGDCRGSNRQLAV